MTALSPVELSTSGGKRFTIRPPTTLKDDGRPSTELRRDVQRVFALIEDERHLTAETLLTSVRQRLAEWERMGKKSPRKKTQLFTSKRDKEREQSREKKNLEMKELKALLESRSSEITKLEVRIVYETIAILRKREQSTISETAY
jgi:hypothetical protein